MHKASEVRPNPATYMGNTTSSCSLLRRKRDRHLKQTPFCKILLKLAKIHCVQLKARHCCKQTPAGYVTGHRAGLFTQESPLSNELSNVHYKPGIFSLGKRPLSIHRRNFENSEKRDLPLRTRHQTHGLAASVKHLKFHTGFSHLNSCGKRHYFQMPLFLTKLSRSGCVSRRSCFNTEQGELCHSIAMKKELPKYLAASLI